MLLGLSVYTDSLDAWWSLDDMKEEIFMEFLEAVDKKEFETAKELVLDENNFFEDADVEYEQSAAINQIELRELVLNDPIVEKIDINKYEFVWENDYVRSNSRIGSYSTIHYLRQFAHELGLLYKKQGIDILKDPKGYKLTKNEVRKILDISAKKHTAYADSNDDIFDNLNNHSDCEDYYLPTQNRISFEYGSSLGLYKELDALYETGAIDFFEELDANFYKEIWMKLMDVAISSLDENSVIVFA